MGQVTETVKTVNSTLRTLLMLVLVGGAGYAGYLAYGFYNQPQKQIAEQQAVLNKTLADLEKAHEDLAERRQEVEKLGFELTQKTAEVERLEVAMKLLKVRRRLARLTVLDQREAPPSDETAQTDASTAEEPSAGESEPGAAPTAPPRVISRIEFVEVNDEGNPIGPSKEFEIVGDLVYIDYLRVTFDDKYVEESDLDRSTAIALFQRIFGEHQEAAQGFQLDEVGTRPTAYARGTDMSDFERKIWNDFWLIANNPARAADLGIHAAHGSAVSMRVQPGKTYEIELRSTGDISIRPVENDAEPSP